jgi:TonB family protein
MTKASILFLALCLICILGLAQNKTSPQIIYKDTINLKGYVYNADGKPAKALINSRSKDLKSNTNFLFAITDSTGYFEINGAYTNDTLDIITVLHRSKHYNKGAHYMVITLPPEIVDVNRITGDINVDTSARYPKIPSSFKVRKEDSEYSCLLLIIDGPNFPGELSGYARYIKRNLKYPAAAIRTNTQGTVEISFTIARDGSVKNPRIIRGIGHGCDEEVINAILKSPKWKPANFNHTGIETQAKISINFRLLDKQ